MIGNGISLVLIQRSSLVKVHFQPKSLVNSELKITFLLEFPLSFGPLGLAAWLYPEQAQPTLILSCWKLLSLMRNRPERLLDSIQSVSGVNSNCTEGSRVAFLVQHILRYLGFRSYELFFYMTALCWQNV